MKKSLKAFVLVAACVAMPAFAADGITDTITAASDTVTLDLAGGSMYEPLLYNYHTVAVQVTGTFTATLTFQSTFDGSTWVSHTVTTAPVAASIGTQVTTATAAGKWYANVSGVRKFRVIATAYTSGTATVVLTAGTGAQLVAIQSMPPLPAGSSALGTVTSVGSVADGVAVSGNPVLVAGQDGTSAQSLLTDSSGRLQVAGAAADDAAIAGAPVPIGIKAVAAAAQPTSATAGDVVYPIATVERIPYVINGHPNPIHCNVAVSTATTIQAVGGSCAAPGAGLSIYVTGINFGSSAASSTAADAFPTIKSGTGGTCGAATAVVWSAMTEANTTTTYTPTTPIRIAANSELCWIHTVAGSKVINITGFIAP